VPRPAAELRPDCAINGGKKKKKEKNAAEEARKWGCPPKVVKLAETRRGIGLDLQHRRIGVSY
jgi:hypothetical protein